MVHPVAAATVLYAPNEQATHEEAPAPEAYEPTAQDVQAVGTTAPGNAEYDPGAQREQAAAPRSAHEPAAHRAHTDAAGPRAYVPDWHWVQVDEKLAPVTEL